MMPAIKTFEIKVRGFPPYNVSARTRGKAMGQAWRSYNNYDDRARFGDFLKICRATRVPDPPGLLKRVMVLDRPATTCLGPSGQPMGHYVHFMWDDSDTITCAHPTDVSPLPEAAHG